MTYVESKINGCAFKNEMIGKRNAHIDRPRNVLQHWHSHTNYRMKVNIFYKKNFSCLEQRKMVSYFLLVFFVFFFFVLRNLKANSCEAKNAKRHPKMKCELYWLLGYFFAFFPLLCLSVVSKRYEKVGRLQHPVLCILWVFLWFHALDADMDL